MAARYHTSLFTYKTLIRILNKSWMNESSYLELLPSLVHEPDHVDDICSRSSLCRDLVAATRRQQNALPAHVKRVHTAKRLKNGHIFQRKRMLVLSSPLSHFSTVNFQKDKKTESAWKVKRTSFPPSTHTPPSSFLVWTCPLKGFKYLISSERKNGYAFTYDITVQKQYPSFHSYTWLWMESVRSCPLCSPWMDSSNPVKQPLDDSSALFCCLSSCSSCPLASAS